MRRRYEKILWWLPLVLPVMVCAYGMSDMADAVRCGRGCSSAVGSYGRGETGGDALAVAEPADITGQGSGQGAGGQDDGRGDAVPAARGKSGAGTGGRSLRNPFSPCGASEEPETPVAAKDVPGPSGYYEAGGLRFVLYRGRILGEGDESGGMRLLACAGGVIDAIIGGRKIRWDGVPVLPLVTATMIGSETKAAIVAGRLVQVGGRTGPFKLADVWTDRVELEVGDRRIVCPVGVVSHSCRVAQGNAGNGGSMSTD